MKALAYVMEGGRLPCHLYPENDAIAFLSVLRNAEAYSIALPKQMATNTET